MKRLLKKAFLVAGVTAIAAGATLAYFSDTETSVGNTFVAGQLDLKISNRSWYHGPNDQGVVGTWPREDLSWSADDLMYEDGLYHLFFDYEDLKPGDWGEDTIDIYIDDNPGWVCMDVEITATPENGQTEPEMMVDPTDGLDDGELQDELQIVFWADDGDNVHEEGEAPLFLGTLQELSDAGYITIADSQFNAWGLDGEPIPGGEEVYIGKAWCYGNLAPAPVPQDGSGDLINPSGAQGPGVTCDGMPVGNESQTDEVVLDVMFEAEQWRHNDTFLCVPE